MDEVKSQVEMLLRFRAEDRERIDDIHECLLGDLADGKPGLVAKVNSHEQQLDGIKNRGWGAIMLALGAFLAAGWRWIFENRQ